MRILFVVQRYGHEVGGGAELHCRQFATHLADRGHDVEALTSCAVSYLTWENHYAPGTEALDGVVVHRLPVSSPRNFRFFSPLDARAVWGNKPVPLFLQEAWMRAQGPVIPELAPWLLDHSERFDVVVFFTYLYYTTWAGLPAAAALRPTVLHPTAHDEPPLYLPLFSLTVRHASAFAFSTEEESRLFSGRFRVARPSSVIGIGTDLDVDADGDQFRSAYGLEEDPYLLFVGRVDPHKGSDELYDFFTTYKELNPGPLRLVFLGDAVKPLPSHPDVITTGFVDDSVRLSAMAGCRALVQPSYFESFSMVLSEAWVMRKPALVQGHCEVLVGQALRSEGAIPYKGFAEFEAAVNLLQDSPKVAEGLGARGRAYVEARYSWGTVMTNYEELLASTAIA